VARPRCFTIAGHGDTVVLVVNRLLEAAGSPGRLYQKKLFGVLSKQRFSALKLGAGLPLANGAGLIEGTHEQQDPRVAQRGLAAGEADVVLPALMSAPASHLACECLDARVEACSARTLFSPSCVHCCHSQRLARTPPPPRLR
jgi:hypothetical protein